MHSEEAQPTPASASWQPSLRCTIWTSDPPWTEVASCLSALGYETELQGGEVFAGGDRATSRCHVVCGLPSGQRSSNELPADVEDLDTTRVFRTLQEVTRGLRGREGSVVVVCSAAAFSPSDAVRDVCEATAMISMTRVLATALAPSVRVNCLCVNGPGLGDPTSTAAAIAFFLGDGASHITGQAVVIGSEPLLVR